MFNLKTPLGRLNLFTIIGVVSISMRFLFITELDNLAYFGIVACIVMVVGTIAINFYTLSK